MVGEVLRARTRAFNDLAQQQQDAERKQGIAQRHRPRRARRQRHGDERRGERNIAHQEGDDVVDRERNQKQRKTDHRRRAFFSSKSEPSSSRQEPSYLTRWPNSGRYW